MSVKMMRLMTGIVLVVLVWTGRSFSQQKTTLAVMDLRGAGVSETDAATLTGALFSGIVNTRSFAVVNLAQRDQVLQEWGFSQSAACGDSACLGEAGRYLRVRKMVGGTIDKPGQAWSVTIRLLDVGTGAVDLSFARDIEGGTDAVLGYLREVAVAISRSGALGMDPAAVLRQAENERAGQQATFEFNLSGGLRVAHDLFTASRTTTAPGYSLVEFASSENRGGYCLEAGVTYAGLGRLAPFGLANYSFDRSKLKSVSVPQYLRSRGLTAIAGASYTVDLTFGRFIARAGAGYDWETSGQQNPYFPGFRFRNNAPAALAGVSFEAPLFLGVGTSLGYTLVYKRCPSSSWSDQSVQYSFMSDRNRHYLLFGFSIKP
jgi:hypothetical protein